MVSQFRGNGFPAYFVLVHYPTLKLVIPPIMTGTLFDDLINGQMLEASIRSKKFTMACLTHARRAGENDIRIVSCHQILIINNKLNCHCLGRTMICCAQVCGFGSTVLLNTLPKAPHER